MTPSKEQIEQQLRTILASERLSSSPRQKKLFDHLVTKALNDEIDDLKGYSIGVDLFDRSVDFDPQSDPVVRVVAGRLRKTLDEYYSDQGIDDPVIISVPSGRYVPAFSYADGSTVGPFGDEREIIPIQKPNNTKVSSFVSTVTQIFSTKILAAIILLAISAIAIFGLIRPDNAVAKWDIKQAAVLPTGPSIVINSFEANISPEAQSFGISAGNLQSGFQYELVEKLSRFKDLRIFDSRTDDAKAALETAKKMGAGYLLTGSIRLDQSRLRVVSVLTSSTDGSVIWSDTFNRNMDSAEPIIDIKSSIATSVASKLGQPYSELNNRFRSDATALTDLDVTHYFCLWEFYDYNDMKSESRHFKIRKCLEKAVKSNPNFSSGWAALSWIYGDEARNGYNVRKSETSAKQRALTAAQRAVRENPGNAMAYQYLAVAAFQLGNDALFRQAAETALRLNVNDPEVLADVGSHLIQLDNSEIGKDLVEKAIAINPVHPSWYHGSIIGYFYLRGQNAKALEHARQYYVDGSLKSSALLAAVLVRTNRNKEAQKIYRQLAVDYPQFKENRRKTIQNWRLPENMDELVLADITSVEMISMPTASTK